MEIDKYIDPDLLRDNAYDTTEEEVRHDFTEEEIIELKNEFFSMWKEQDTREKALEQFSNALKEDYDQTMIMETLNVIAKMNFGDRGIKSLKKESQHKGQIINRGYDIVVMKLYAFAYHEIDRMAFYKEDGHYLYDRPMKSNERQLKFPNNIRQLS